MKKSIVEMNNRSTVIARSPQGDAAICFSKTRLSAELPGLIRRFSCGLRFLQSIAMTTLTLALLFILPMSDGFAMGRKPKTFNVEVKVDFGPAGKPAIAQTLEVERGSTAKDAVSQVAPVLSGKSCCSLRELAAIDGVKVEPEKSNWWICLLNGSKNFNPRTKKLSPGDIIEWKYIHEARCPLGKKQS